MKTYLIVVDEDAINIVTGAPVIGALLFFREQPGHEIFKDDLPGGWKKIGYVGLENALRVIQSDVRARGNG